MQINGLIKELRLTYAMKWYYIACLVDFDTEIGIHENTFVESVPA